MRFSDNGYYIEKYVKCMNCGVLLYDEGRKVTRDDQELTFCSEWCEQWSAMRDAGVEEMRLPLPRD